MNNSLSLLNVWIYNIGAVDTDKTQELLKAWTYTFDVSYIEDLGIESLNFS